MFCSLFLANNSKVKFYNSLSANFKAIVPVFGKPGNNKSSILRIRDTEFSEPATRDTRRLDYLQKEHRLCSRQSLYGLWLVQFLCRAREQVTCALQLVRFSILQTQCP